VADSDSGIPALDPQPLGGWLGVEWPTMFVAIAIYAAWLGLTWFQARIPTWLLLPVGAITIAWHSSFQHEAIHRHPTRLPWLNWILAFPPFTLWLPLESYRHSHLAHHDTPELTDPHDDPESKYFSSAQWARLGTAGRVVAATNATLLGRLLLGPALMISGFLVEELKDILRGDQVKRRYWAVHLAGVAVILAWLISACHMNLLRYILCFVYPGQSLALVRSFAEHRAVPGRTHRTAIVEHGPFWALLFLNNNLHVVHHAHPHLPWYRLPQVYRTHRAAYLRLNGGLFYPSYAALFRRYLIKPHDVLLHPACRPDASPSVASQAVPLPPNSPGRRS
jgi:fatty acid desaturase